MFSDVVSRGSVGVSLQAESKIITLVPVIPRIFDITVPLLLCFDEFLQLSQNPLRLFFRMRIEFMY